MLFKSDQHCQGPARAVHVPAAVCAHQLGGHPGRQVGPQRPGKLLTFPGLLEVIVDFYYLAMHRITL